MDIRKWCSSGRRRSLRLGGYYNEPHKSSWRVFWIKFKREKIARMANIFRSSAISSSSAAVNPRRLVPYDPCSYSQNFDRGSAWDDHDDEPDDDDNLSRSFSFRFADPSKNLVKLDKEMV